MWDNIAIIAVKNNCLKLLHVVVVVVVMLVMNALLNRPYIYFLPETYIICKCFDDIHPFCVGFPTRFLSTPSASSSSSSWGAGRVTTASQKHSSCWDPRTRTHLLLSSFLLLRLSSRNLLKILEKLANWNYKLLRRWVTYGRESFINILLGYDWSLLRRYSVHSYWILVTRWIIPSPWLALLAAGEARVHEDNQIS